MCCIWDSSCPCPAALSARAGAWCGAAAGVPVLRHGRDAGTAAVFSHFQFNYCKIIIINNNNKIVFYV